MAVIFPLCENDALGMSFVPRNSSPLQSCRRLPAMLTEPKPDLPSIFSANVISSGPVQVRYEGDDSILGVRLRAGPPETGTIKISPPVGPSSLMRPSMKATFLPSRETVGFAI